MVADDIEVRNARVEKVRRLVFKLAMRAANRFGVDSDDVAQDAMLHVLARFPQYDPTVCQFSTWAGWRVRAAVSRALRRRDRGRLVRTLAAIEDGDADPWESIAGPEADPAAGMVAADLRRAVDGLPERQRVLIRRYYGLDGRGGATAADLAAEQSVSRAWVSKDILAAVALLREIMRADAPDGWATDEGGEADDIEGDDADRPVVTAAGRSWRATATASPPP